MKTWIEKHSEGKKVIALLIITNIIYLLMLLVTIPKVMSYSDGMKIFDRMPKGYSVDYATSLLDALGPEGRNAYLFSQIPLDVFYPGLFGLTYCLLMAYFLKKLSWFDKPLFYLSLLPLIGGLFDYLENIGIVYMLSSYPDFSTLVAQWTNRFTMTKSLFSMSALIILIALALLTGVKKIISRVTLTKSA